MSTDPETLLLHKELKGEITEAMAKCLNAREERIIRQHFGLGGGPRATYKELSSEYGVTTTRIQQISNRAIQKLKRYWGLEGVVLTTKDIGNYYRFVDGRVGTLIWIGKNNVPHFRMERDQVFKNEIKQLPTVTVPSKVVSRVKRTVVWEDIPHESL